MERVHKPPTRRRTDEIKLDFRLQFQASRVPNSGWDKLVVSLISAERGKTTVKTSRGHVRNGTCQWPDPVVESTRIIQDLASGQYDEKVHRILVQMGSLRVGILGETSINLAEYIHADSPDTISLPLRNCCAGTVLHVKIQCISPKVSSRDLERPRGPSMDQEDLGPVPDDDGTGSDLSEKLTVGSVTSSRNRYSGNSQGQPKPVRIASPNGRQKDVPSPATLGYSSDSFESLTHGNSLSNGSGGRLVSKVDEVSPPVSSNNISRWLYSGANHNNSIGTENSRSSFMQTTKHRGEAGYSPKGWQDSYNQLPESIQNPTVSPLEIQNRTHSGLSQRLEAAEATIQELRQESLTWERRSHKLRVEVETLKQQLANEVRNRAEIGIELSALKVERDNLVMEVEQLKTAKLASKQRDNDEDYIRWEVEDSKRLIKALQEESSYEKEVNADFRLQLCKLQDSNAELVLALNELEETIEMKDRDIERLEKENCGLEEQRHEAWDPNAELFPAVKDMEGTVHHKDGRKDMRTETTESVSTFDGIDEMHQRPLFDDDMPRRMKVPEQQQNFAAADMEFRKREMARVQGTEQLEAKIWNLLEEAKGLNTRDATWREETLSDVETDCLQKLVEKDKKVDDSSLKLIRMEDGVSTTGAVLPIVKNNIEKDLQQTIERLKGKLEEQDIDCKELTDENVELHYQLGRVSKELKSKMDRIAQLEAGLDGFPSLKTATSLEELLQNQVTENQGLIDALKLQVDELTRRNTFLQDQLQESAMNFEALPKKYGEYHKDLLHRQMEGTGVEDQDILSATSVSDRMEEIEVDEPECDLVDILSSRELQPKTRAEESSSSDKKSTTCDCKLSILNDENANLQGQLRQVSVSKETSEVTVHELQKQKDKSQPQHLELENSRTSDLLSMCDGEIKRHQHDSAIHIAAKNRLEVEVSKYHSETEKLIRELADRETSERQLEARLIEAEKQRDLLESKVQDLVEERGLSKSRIDELEFQLPILSEEIKLLNAAKHEYESIALKLEMEKVVGQEKLDEAQDESRTARERLEELVGQMAALTTTRDSQLIAKRSLERRASELESDKEELESQVVDLEEENLQFSERISGLEAQLRCVTEERENYKLGMETAEARANDYKAEKKRSDNTFQEAWNEHQQQLAESERQRGIILQEAEKNSQIRQNLDQELKQSKDEVTRLRNLHRKLEDTIADLQVGQSVLEHQLREVASECTSVKVNCSNLEAEIAHQQRESEQRETVFKAEIGELVSFRDDLQHRANKAEEEVSQLQLEKSSVVNGLQNELQLLTEQLSSRFDEKEKLASQALVEACELRSGKKELEESLKHTQENFRKMEEDSAVLQNKLESKISAISSEMAASKKVNIDLTHRLRELETLFERTHTAAADDKSKVQKLEMLLLKSEHEKQSLMKEQNLLNCQVSELIAVTSETETLKRLLDQMNTEKKIIELSLEKMSVQCESMQEEKNIILEKLTASEGTVADVDELRQQKLALEEKVARFQSLLEAHDAGKIQEAEQRNAFIRLKRNMSQVQRKLFDQEREMGDFQSKIESLEEKLELKSHALSKTEKQLKSVEASESVRNMDRSKSKTGLASPSKDSKELIELRERLRSLEVDVRAREEEIGRCKRQLMEREAELCDKIECLEQANEQLAIARVDTEEDQLKKEIIRLQNQNSSLSRKEQELLSKMHTQGVLQEEVQRLEEANDLMEARLSKFMEAAKNPYLLEKMVNLETELAEAIEANNMYKLQLQSVFDKQQNVSMAALHNLGDLDQVVNDLFSYKKKATQLEDELHGMHERYSLMSLQLAEAEAERGELLRTVKSLKNTNKA